MVMLGAISCRDQNMYATRCPPGLCKFLSSRQGGATQNLLDYIDFYHGLDILLIV